MKGPLLFEALTPTKQLNKFRRSEKGSCFLCNCVICGVITTERRWQLDGPLIKISFANCSDCRKDYCGISVDLKC